MEDTKFEPTDDEIFFKWTDKDGVEHDECIEETILAKLLIDEIVFCNTRPYVQLDDDFKGYKTKKIGEETIVIFVNCNDIWMWACADAEPITTNELPELYKMYKADKKWGSLKWACKKRNLQPQAPIVKDMKKEGAWCALMESLPKNKN